LGGFDSLLYKNIGFCEGCLSHLLRNTFKKRKRRISADCLQRAMLLRESERQVVAQGVESSDLVQRVSSQVLIQAVERANL
jgi:hypothetical protein